MHRRTACASATVSWRILENICLTPHLTRVLDLNRMDSARTAILRNQEPAEELKPAKPLRRNDRISLLRRACLGPLPGCASERRTGFLCEFSHRAHARADAAERCRTLSASAKAKWGERREACEGL